MDGAQDTDTELGVEPVLVNAIGTDGGCESGDGAGVTGGGAAGVGSASAGGAQVFVEARILFSLDSVRLPRAATPSVKDVPQGTESTVILVPFVFATLSG